MSNQSQPQTPTRRHDPNFRAPLRDILDSIGTGRHVEGTHVYDEDGHRKRVRVVQLANGLGLVDDMSTSKKEPAAKDTSNDDTASNSGTRVQADGDNARHDSETNRLQVPASNQLSERASKPDGIEQGGLAYTPI
ncbi:hypothetical protein LTR70_007090 [Exophiala xenobiotica]|uniref:Uncharacterized protein n=1 Tax=Lithohypha guttulata TaxID=1690604 RepID=A0ABR0K6F9_9EURO|nr:hypothetical protein LTR24_006275 [Lithohypha guttulata]KAK5314653.1 hypothetical protein LTR70_007090 [Exophiala xenobiotica]